MRQPMNVAVLYMDDDYSIAKIENKLVPAESTELIYDIGAMYIEDDKVDFDKDFFKVFISDEKIDDISFEQSGIERKIVQLRGTKTRAIRRRNRPSEWATKMIELNLTRHKDDIGKSSVSLLNGQITIQPNTALQAEIGISAANAKTKITDNTNLLPQIFNDKTASIINFGTGTRSTEDKSILILDNIKGEHNLQKSPIEMTIHQELTEEEFILPVMFDGEFIVPIGEVDKDTNGNTKITIKELPNVETSDQPEVEQSRSLTRAVKLAFMKLALKKSGESLFILRKGDWDEEGVFSYDEDADLKAEVAKASKIMMFVHGIIGETESSTKELEFAKKEFGYDLILTFDYENLNSDIVEIATNLKLQLNNAGILPNDGKHFDIIVHSLGGLVSRTMLEKLGGHTFVDNLIMFGTPNGGSRFGKIVDYQNFAIAGLTFAMNIFKPLTTHFGGLLFGLKTFQKLTTTLGQMNSDSDFIKDLYENDIGQIQTKYHVIAADMTEYIAQGDSKVGQFMDKAMVRTGNTVYQGIKNDIAVATDDILKIPTARNTTEYVVAGHHMNYFILEKPMQILKDIMKNMDSGSISTPIDTSNSSNEPVSDDSNVINEPVIIKDVDQEIEPKIEEKPTIKITSSSKSILITGASTGIGYSCAKEFLKAGYLVFGSVRKKADANRLLTELGNNFVPLLFDVTDQLGVEAAVSEVEKHLNGKGLGGLINNAGIAYGGVIQYQPIEQIEQQFDVNVIGLLRVTKAFLPLLGAQENFTAAKGRIINISSMSGKIAFPFVGSYVGTKHAVEGISDSLRRELLLFGIDVIIVGPGAIKTPIWGKGIVDMASYNDTPYGKIVNRFAKFMKKSGEKGLTPEYLSERIFHIFEKKKPKTRYSIVPGSNFFNFTIPTWLPSRWLDRIIGKQTGLKK
jgi:short-subunit dehydrogenase